jgi:hypothetical protein
VIFGRVGVVLAAAVVVSSLVACGTTAKEVEPVASPDGPSEPDTMADATANTADPKPVAPPKVTGGPGAGTSDAGTRELTQSDCHALAQKYGSLTRSDEEAKLSPKLTPTQRNTASGAIEKAAQTLADRWEGGCSRDLAGKFASEEALKCSMAAKTVSAFDVCLNGPATPAP